MAQIQSELNISLKLAAQETDYLSRTIQALQLVRSWRTPSSVQKHICEQKPNPWITLDPVKTEYLSEQEKPNPWLTPVPLKTQYSSEQDQEREQSPKDRIITLNEVSNHDVINDCWVIIYDRVYDITTFMDEHPGGSEIMLEYAGRDASTAFRGSGHSRSAVRALDRFLVGELPMHERIYRKPGGIRLSDIPE